MNLWFRSIHEFRERRNKTGEEQFSLPFGKIENKLFDETLIRYSSLPQAQVSAMKLDEMEIFRIVIDYLVLVPQRMCACSCVLHRSFMLFHFSRASKNDLFCQGKNNEILTTTKYESNTEIFINDTFLLIINDNNITPQCHCVYLWTCTHSPPFSIMRERKAYDSWNMKSHRNVNLMRV